jgi:hypothetical protein
MNAWVPQEAGLVQLCQLFAELQKGSNQAQVGSATRVSPASTQDQSLSMCVSIASPHRS